MKHYKSDEILSISRVSSPPNKPKSPPQKRKVPLWNTFWRRFWTDRKQTHEYIKDKNRQKNDYEKLKTKGFMQNY